MTARRRAPWLAAAIVVATAATALGQPVRRPFPVPVPPTPTATVTATAAAPAPSSALESSHDLRARFGIEIANRLVHSGDPRERLQGIVRAGQLGSPEAVALLASAADPTGSGRSDPRALIEIARALAPFAGQAAARSALLATVSAAPSARAIRLGDPGGDDGDAAGRLLLARQTAAMALASSGDARAIDGLLSVARTPGPSQPIAVQALTAHPPPPHVSLGSTLLLLTPQVIGMVVDLGDLRALPGLRQAGRASDAPTRAAALVALGEMGDGRAVELARLALAEREPRLRAAGAEALVLLDAPERLAAVEALIGDDATADAGVRLARRADGPGIARALAARAAAASDPELRAAAVFALGRSTAPDATRALAAFVKDPELQGDAAHALARSPHAGALAVIERMMAERSPAMRRLGVRAALVRALTRGERSGELLGVAEQLSASRDVTDRALAAFVKVALGELALARALAERDPAVRRAAAAASLAARSAASDALLLRAAAREHDATTRVVLFAGLAGGDPDGDVTTLTLAERAQAGEADAPLAAMALARRIDVKADAAVDALLASRDRVVRAHAARGLGASDAPDAVGRLAAAYTYEPDASVRAAIVAALAARTGPADAAAPARLETLGVAARLDPDRGVRFTAGRALGVDRDVRAARISSSPPRPRDRDATDATEVVWLRLVALARPTAATPPAAIPSGMTATLVRADGLAIPVSFDDDGYALVLGVPPGEGRLVLAPRLPAYDSRPR